MKFAISHIKTQKKTLEKLVYEALLLLAGMLFGLIPVLSTVLHQDGYHANEIIFLRLTFSGLLALILVLASSIKFEYVRPYQMITRKDFVLICIQGFLLVLMIYVYILSIAFDIPSGEAALLVQIQPITTILLSYILFGEKITQNQYIALGFAFIGVVLLTRPWQFDLGSSSLIGDLLALLNGIFYSIYLIVGRFYQSTKKKTIFRSNTTRKVLTTAFQRSPAEKIVLFSYVLIIAAVLNIGITSVLNILISPHHAIYPLLGVRLTKLYDLPILSLTIILAVFCTIIPYALIAVSTQKVTGAQIAFLLLVEPVSATLLGWIFLKQTITIYLFFGGFFICFAVILASKDKRKI